MWSCRVDGDSGLRGVKCCGCNGVVCVGVVVMCGRGI